MKKAEKEKLRNEIIDEGIRQGLSANEILRRLQKREVGIQRKKGLEIIRKRKGKRKKAHAEKHIPKKYRKKFICMEYVIVKRWYEDNYEQHWLEKTDRAVSEAYRAVEEYDFYEHTRYDEVRFIYWISSDTKDWEKRLCFRKLKSLILIIFENFERLKLDEIRDEFDNLLFEFSREEIEHRKHNFRTLKKVVDILNKKEEGEWEKKEIS